MTDPEIRPNSVPWPPLIYVAAAVLAVSVHWLIPLPWPDGALRIVLAAVGLCGVCAGIALELVTLLTFRKNRTTVLPHRGATHLITDGPFAKSRNPIYLGNTLLMFGAGLLFGVAWLLPAGLGAAVLVQKLAIEREERHLSAKFKDEWKRYAERTPRWLW